jgi:hypothetical protein
VSPDPELAIKLVDWVVDHRHAVCAKQAHERGAWHAGELRRLADADPVKTDLLDQPQRSELTGEGVKVAVRARDGADWELDGNGDGLDRHRVHRSSEPLERISRASHAIMPRPPGSPIRPWNAKRARTQAEGRVRAVSTAVETIGSRAPAVIELALKFRPRAGHLLADRRSR